METTITIGFSDLQLVPVETFIRFLLSEFAGVPC